LLGIEEVVPVVVLTSAALVSCWQFVAPGHPTTVDAWSHLVRTQVVADAINQGFLPFYSFMFYSGYPLLRFYSPLLYLLAGPVASISSSLAGLQAVLVVAHLASVGTMYLFLRTRFSTAAALLGTMVFALVPWRVRHITALANYPQALLYPLMPLGFLCVQKLVRRPGLRPTAGLGLVLGLAFLSHLVHALPVGVMLLAFLFAARRSSPRGVVARYSLVAMLLAAGLASGVLVPFLAEYRAHVFPRLDCPLPTPDLLVCLGLTTKSGGFVGGYLGLSCLALSIVGAAVLLTKRATRTSGLLFTVGALLALLMPFVGPRLNIGGLVRGANLLPERWFMYLVFLLGVLSAAGADFLGSKVARSGPLRVGLFLLLSGIVLADCLRFQFPPRRVGTDELLAGRKEQYQRIISRQPAKLLDVCVPNGRIDDVPRNSIYPAMGFLYGRLASPLGPQYHQFAPRCMAYCYPWIGMLAGRLAVPKPGRDGAAVVKAAALLGISHLTLLPSSHWTAAGQGSLDSLLEFDMYWDLSSLRKGYPIVTAETNTGLVLASSAIAPMPDERLVPMGSYYVASDWASLLDASEVVLESNRLNCIALPSTGQARTLPGQPAVRVLRTEFGHEAVSVELVTSHECFLRIALSHYPWLQVRLDETPIPFQETKDHFIVATCPPGRHSVRVSAPLSPLRGFALLASLTALAVGLVMLVAPLPREKQPKEN